MWYSNIVINPFFAFNLNFVANFVLHSFNFSCVEYFNIKCCRQTVEFINSSAVISFVYFRFDNLVFNGQSGAGDSKQGRVPFFLVAAGAVKIYPAHLAQPLQFFMGDLAVFPLPALAQWGLLHDLYSVMPQHFDYLATGLLVATYMLAFLGCARPCVFR